MIDIGYIDLKNLVIIFFMFCVPGWLLLSFTNYWKQWTALQRWILAISLSLVSYPVLFYFLRIIFPGFHFNRIILFMIGFVGLIILIIRERKNFKVHIAFDKYEILAIGIILLTLFTRFLILKTHPYPAWTDSLHHTLLTNLFAQNGQLPYTLEPYEPVSLSMYHLGLYTITGTFQILSSVQAHTALLWVAQFLSGLCGIGIYLYLDKHVSRKAAIVGLLIAGFFSFQPNWYFNWGRFTQLASQTVMVTAMVVNLELLKSFSEIADTKKKIPLAIIILASLLNAGAFLFHYRVAIFYVLFLLIIVAVYFKISFSQRKLKQFLIILLLVAIISMILISPSIFQAFEKYVQYKTIDSASQTSPDYSYYEFPLSSYFSLGLPKWLFIVTLILLGFGLIRKNKQSILMLLWLILLFALGYLYVLKIPFLMVTNLGAIIIMLYIPASIIIGIGYEELINSKTISKYQDKVFLVILLLGLIFSYIRIFDIEESRFFLSNEDIDAMVWINENLPKDAKFGINTTFWLTNSPHGVDGGYWIPYFTGRKTTTGTMIFSLGSKDYQKTLIDTSKIISKASLDSSLNDLSKLCDFGVEYFYFSKQNYKMFNETEKIFTKVFSNNEVEIVNLNCK